MDTSLLLGRPELRWWFSLTITYPLSHLRLDALTVCKASWPQHQQQGDRNYGADKFIYLGSIIIEMEEVTWTSRAGPILWIKYGVPPLTVLVLSWTSITAASRQLSYIVKKFWRLTEKDLWKLSAFHTKSPRRILRIFLHNFISNKDLLEQCGKEPMATILTRRRW